MKNLRYRIVSLVLAVLMVCSPCTVALADGVQTEGLTEVLAQPMEDLAGQAAEEAEENTETLAEENTEGPQDPAVGTDENEETSSGESEAEELPLDETEEEPIGEEQAEGLQEEEDCVLPFGFVGLPQSYVLNEQELAAKALLNELEVLELLSEAEPDEDYVEGQVVLLADSLEYAQMAAEAYCGELESYEAGVAVILLQTATTAQAVEAAADMQMPLPAVDPNWIMWMEPEPEEPEMEISLFSAGEEVPVKQDWQSWYYGLLEDGDDSTNPDSWLENPNYNQNARYQWMHDMVNSYEAWGSSTGEGVTVAVIDSGVRATHKDLQGRVEMVQVSGLPTEPYGDHGTHVAGIVAAKMGNGYMGAGIAPDAKILSLRIMDNSGGTAVSNLTAAINLAVLKGADIINLSLGSYTPAAANQMAIARAVEQGVVVMAAMGNDGTNIKSYPAAYEGVIAVSAVDKDGMAADFSSVGDWSDLSAPGVDISSTYGYSDAASGKKSGTSMACPVVAGVAALYLSCNPDATPAEVEAALKKAAAKPASGGIGGIVDAAALFEKDTTAPVISVSCDGVDYASGDVVPFHSNFNITAENGSSDEVILFTVDGKTPSAKEGKVVVGEIFDPSSAFTVSHLVEQYGVPVGKSFTIKAVRINGQGEVSKAASFRMTCDYNPDTESVNITADRKISLTAGKSVTLGVVVQPATADPAVVWSVDLNGMADGSVTIDSKSGKLTSESKAEGVVTVRAEAANGIYDEIEIQIAQPQRAARIVLNDPPKTIALPRQGQSPDVCQIEHTVYDSKSDPLEDIACHWSSSKPSVLAVEAETGTLTPISKGSAVITCRALDGSGKYAKCSVTVTQPVEKIILSGNTQITAGGYATVKAEVLPKTASNKKVIWSIDQQALSMGAKISASGKVTLPKNYTGNLVEVTAASVDGISEILLLEVLPGKAKTVTMQTADPRAEYTSRGVLNKATIYSADIAPADTALSADKENIFQLTAQADNGAKIGWSSSNTKAAVVDENGTVTAVKPGTAKITATALDGSNKKACVTVKVVTPASSLKLSTTQGITNWMGTEYHVLASGKSASIKSTLGDAYGKPTSKTVNYSFSISLMDHYTGKPVQNEYTSELLDYIVSQKMIKVSSSGKVSVSSKFKKFWETYCWGWYEVSFELTGHIADGAANDTLRFILSPYLTTEIMLSDELTDDIDPVRTLVISRSSKPVVYLYSDSYWVTDYIFTSSNPSVVGVAGQKTWYDDQNLAHHITLVTGKNPGTATITAKAKDGSGKSLKFTVKVV